MTTPRKTEGVPPAQPRQGEPGDEGSHLGGEVSISRIQVFNLVFVVAAILAALLFRDKATAIGVALGGGLMVASFFIITAVTRAVFGKDKPSLWPVLVYWFKFALLMALVGVLILVFDIDTMGILIGFSVVLPSIVLEAILKLAQSGEPESER